MIFPYLKCAPKLSSGAKGLSETMVEPIPEAWTGIRYVLLFSMSKMTVSLNVSVSFRLAVSVSSTSLSGGTVPSLGSTVQRDFLCACNTRLQVNSEDILGFSFCTCQSPLYFKCLALQNSTSETNIIFLNQSSWVFVGFSFFFFKKQYDSEEQTYNSTFECAVKILYISFLRRQPSSLTSLY